MKSFHYNKLLIFVIVLGLISSLAIDFERHRVEERNKQIDLAMDYEGLLELAAREGRSAEEVLARAKEAGISSLAVYETTFKKLNANGKASAVPGADVLSAYHMGTLADPAWRVLVEKGEIKREEVYVTGHDAQTFQELKEDLPLRLGAERVRTLKAGKEEILAVKAFYEAFLKMNVGMPTDELKAVNAAGFYVLARPSNYEGCSKEDVAAVFQRLAGIEVSEVVFSGPQILGATKEMQATIDAFQERDYNLGLIEGVTQLQFYKQDGMEELVKGIGYDHIVRLYSIPKDEQPKMKIADAVERWANTDMERNIRINLMRIYDKPSPNLSLMETNMQYIHDTKVALEKSGFTIGKAGTYENVFVERALRALVMAGVAAAAVLYLALVLPRLNASTRGQLLLVVILALAAAVPVLMGNGTKIRVLAALASANLFPTLAMVFLLDRIRRKKRKWKGAGTLIGTGLVALFVTGALSYVGAAYLSASLVDTSYLLEFSIFRGIKLTFVLPLALVAIAFLQRFDVFDGKMDHRAGVMAQVKEILNIPVKIKTLFILLLMLVAGVIFVARSGHTSGMPVSNLELQFRAFLEQVFYARPRSKELLIGHPAFLLAWMAFWRKWPTMVFFALIMVATIGQGSMVETFAHMRTPIYMSFMRGIGGIVLGGGIGAIGIVLAAGWNRVMEKAKV